MNKRWFGSTLLLLGLGCGDSIAPKPETVSDEAKPEVADAGPSSEGEVVELTVDASDMQAWVYLDLDTQTIRTEPSKDTWDLSFKRFQIAMNGGVSGAGGVEVAALKDVSFESVISTASSTFASDAKDGSDDDLEPEYVMSTGESGWYDYDPTNHTLTPRGHVYLVRTTASALFKLEVADYYNEAGSSGHFSLRFALLERGDTSDDEGSAPLPEADAGSAGEPDAQAAQPGDAGLEPDFTSLSIDASASESWVYVSVTSGILSLDAPNGLGWDLAFQRTRIQTNGGTSGEGMGGARLLGAGFEDPIATPSDGSFEVDTLLPIPGPPGSGEFSGNPVLNAWYDYDPSTHATTPKAQAYLVRTAGGGYAKLRINSYASGKFSIDLGALAP